MNIYLDIDGVLLANDKQAANHAHEFLEFIVSKYPTYWLTTHCHGDASTAVERLALIFPPETIELCKKILPTDWDIAKTEGIDFSQDFLWFDDDLFPDEKADLLKNKALDKWIEVYLYKDPNHLKLLIEHLR